MIEQRHRHRAARRAQPFDTVCWSSVGQEQQRGDQPGAEQQQRDAGHPLGQPMLAALARRAEAADLARAALRCRRGSLHALPEDRTRAAAVRTTEPTMVRTAKRLVDAELEGRAGVHHQVADARQQMLEERPGQADQDDQPERMRRELAREVGIGVRPRRRAPSATRSRMPRPDDGQADAGHAVEDRNSHVRPPSPDGQMGRERAWIRGVSHGCSVRCRARARSARQASRRQVSRGRLTRS